MTETDPHDSRDYERTAALAEAVESARRNGARLDIDALARRHGVGAEAIRSSIATLEALAAVAAHSRDRFESDGDVLPLASDTAGHGVDGEDSVLGDFRLIRRIGSGGMGIVYEAEQVSLGRNVALKILPHASTHDPRQIERFQREARATGSLEHPHVVPVLAIGFERGVHFYAMRLIDGDNLADKLRLLGVGQCPPDATTRATLADPRHLHRGARYARQAADALAHAHERGVVHRDIKPSNWMIDTADNVCITDFGLASLEGDPGATRTGDVLGSVPYLSPEQALGHRDVDARTDVYSVGATLYEWLTLQRIFDGSSRADVARKIAQRAPKPPRRLNPAIPRELETIVLRALARRPSDRYASARDLADDLDRFLAGEHVHARRPTAAERAIGFVSRHRRAAAFAGTGLVLAVLGLALFSAALWNETRRADRERVRATAHAARARQIVDDLLTRVANETLDGTPRSEELRRDLLEDALRYYEGFVVDAGDDPEIRRQASLARGRVGKIYERLDRLDEAEAAYRQSIREHGELLRRTDAQPVTELRQELARAWNNLGVVALRAGRNADATDANRRSIALKEELVATDPEHVEFRLEYARSLSNLSVVLARCGDAEGAAQAGTRAMEVKQRLVDEHPDNPGYRDELAMSYCGLAREAESRGRYADARTWFTRAIDELRDLVARDYKPASTRESLHGCIGLRGTCAARDADWAAARTDFDAALEGFARLVNDYPDVPEYRGELANFLSNRGLLALQLGNAMLAEAKIREALDHREALVTEQADSLPRRRDLAESLHHLGDVLARTGHIDRADAEYRRAQTLREEIVRQSPDDVRFRFDLAAGLSATAGLAMMRGDLERAGVCWQRSAELFEQLDAGVDHVERLCAALGGLVQIAFAEGRFGEARATLRRLLALRRRLLESSPDHPRMRRALADVSNDLAWFLLFGNERSTADAREARALAERAVELAPEIGAYWNTVGVARCRMGAWLDAIEALEKSVAARDGGDANDWSFLALAHAMLGNPEAARGYHTRAREDLAQLSRPPSWLIEVDKEVERALQFQLAATPLGPDDE